jgi:endo-1,4-beta-xylanase
MTLFDRRTVLSGLIGSGLTAATTIPQSVGAISGPKVKDLAAARGLLFGSAFDDFVFRERDYAQLLRDECQILTPDYNLKFGSIRPAPGVSNFAAADRLFAFAERDSLLMRGHNLIWNEFQPDWVRQLSKSETMALLDRHIDEVAGRYSGRVHSWDVVNEPIWPDHNNVGGLRGGPWFSALGPEYIDRSFRRARQADPKAKLVLNDAGLEGGIPLAYRRRENFLQLVKRLLDKGVPVDAIGFESHLTSPEGYDREPFLEFAHSIQDLGLDIYVTELDVGDARLPEDVDTRDQIVADVYRRYLSDIVQFPSLKVIVTWELSDKFSWRAEDARFGRSQRWPRPLPFDIHMQPKPAYQAIIDAIGKRKTL